MSSLRSLLGQAIDCQYKENLLVALNVKNSHGKKLPPLEKVYYMRDVEDPWGRLDFSRARDWYLRWERDEEDKRVGEERRMKEST